MRQQFRKRVHASHAVALKACRLKFHRGHMRLDRVKKNAPPRFKRARRIKSLKRGWKPFKNWIHANAHRRAAARNPRLKKIGWVILFNHVPHHRGAG
jgi:hypothetical protein